MSELSFTHENNGSNSYLVYTIENIEKINKLEYNMITNNSISGLLSVVYSSIDDKYFYKYDISSKIPLKRYISSCQQDEKIVKILISILKMLIEAEDFLISKDHIVLDENYIFVDVSNISLHFICLPVDEKINNQSLKEILSNVVCSVNLENSESRNKLFFMKNIFDNEDFFNIKELINTIKGFYNRSNSNLKQDEYVQDKKIETVNEILVDTQKRNIKKLNEDMPIKNENAGNVKFLVPGQDKNFEIKKNENKISLKNIFKPKKSSKKHLKSNMPEKITEINNNTDEEYNNTVLIKPAADSEETVLLHALNSGLYSASPYLVRNKTGEKINITSDLFRIGKEQDYVDYAINDNNTISRAHADIIAVNENYYIQDNNSKNHTYVNDDMIHDDKAVKLEHNYEIRLSDEMFVFKLY